jgi:hypothetical protein
MAALTNSINSVDVTSLKYSMPIEPQYILSGILSSDMTVIVNSRSRPCSVLESHSAVLMTLLVAQLAMIVSYQRREGANTSLTVSSMIATSLILSRSP